MPTKTRIPHGWQANSNGLNWELDVKNRVIRLGYREWSEPPTLLVDEPYFVHRWPSPFRDICHTPMELDFWLYHPQKFRDGLILECKTQESGGSTDDKLIRTVLSLKGTGKRAILLLKGSGFRQEVVQYCKEQMDDNLLVLTTWDEFTIMCDQGHL